jgi:hypothetical protein
VFIIFPDFLCKGMKKIVQQKNDSEKYTTTVKVFDIHQKSNSTIIAYAEV